MAEGGTCQDMETNRLTEVHSLPGDGRGRCLSGYGKRSTDPGALTSWGRQREVLVRTRNEIDRLRCTHQLEIAEGRTCQDTERNQPNEVHTPTGDSREGGTCQDMERNRLTEAHLLAGDGRGRDLL